MFLLKNNYLYFEIYFKHVVTLYQFYFLMLVTDKMSESIFICQILAQILWILNIIISVVFANIIEKKL